MRPITSITIAMAAPMKTNTPVTPKCCSVKAIRKAFQIDEKRLQD